MKTNTILILLATILSLGSNTAHADLFINSNAGIPFETTGLTGFGTTSADMVGLQIIVTFDDNSTELVTWTTTGAFGSGWSLVQGPGSTFSSPFTFSNSSGQTVVNITMHGEGTTTMFDRAGNPSTSGTASGRDLVEVSSYSASQDINATYFDLVQLAGAAPVGDIFAGLSIDFSVGIASGGADFAFITDTDTATTILVAVPEPGHAMFLFTFSCAALILFRRARSIDRR